ncbi:MAG: low specificity L-threonine aldolase [Rhodobacteraceae bacterium]|nr:low specificity L-threonine aldolase [Paracoccaceae bacterium]
MFFGSDNTSGVHPEVMQALVKANDGFAPSYGSDPIMDEVRARVRDIFEAPDAAVFLVSTGSTANVLSLATFCAPWQKIYCHPLAHISTDECGAPEFHTGGAKLALVDGADGKISPDALRATIGATAQGDVHAVQRGPLSITNVTELGAVYSPAEVAKLCAIAKEWDLPCHLDGARFANALVASGATPAEMTWKAGIDVLSLGGTKNGLMGVEAVVIFDPEKAWEFELRRKRGGHLFSKHRFLSAQFLAYLTDDLWLTMARHANAMGGRLAQGIVGLPGGALLHPADANMVFAALARAAHMAARSAGAVYYPWPRDWPANGPKDEPLTARLVCSWSTTGEDIDRLLQAARG